MNKKKYLSILDDIKKGGSELGDNPNENVLVIDGLNTFIRVFSVIPTINDDGTHIGGIVGFLKSIGYTINMFRPTRCIIVFDGKGGSSRRRKLYPEYKAKRKTNIRLNRAYDFQTIEQERENMIRQIQRTIDYLEYLPVTLLSIDNVEADDIIAYTTKQVLKDSKVTIMSSDKDFLQLVNDRISVWAPTKKKLYTPENVLGEYGIPSHNLLMYRIFDGDKSDNIDGIRGYGLKTVIKKLPFLQEEKRFSVDDAINELSELEEHRKIMERNFDLMQLHNVDISASAKTKTIDKIREPIPNLDKETFKKMFLEDKMYSALPNLETWLQTQFQTLIKFIGQ
jgi:DNA polymerase-1